MIQIYCGDGKGKTSAAFGSALRMAGHKKNVLIVQFLKGNPTGEVNSIKELPYITVNRCKKNYGFFWNMSEDDKKNIYDEHNRLVLSSLSGSYSLIIFDEIFAALKYSLLDEDNFLNVLKQLSDSNSEIILTGRDPAKKFLEMADYVSEIKKIKHPYDKGITARAGIEY